MISGSVVISPAIPADMPYSVWMRSMTGPTEVMGVRRLKDTRRIISAVTAVLLLTAR